MAKVKVRRIITREALQDAIQAALDSKIQVLPFTEGADGYTLVTIEAEPQGHKINV